jgi:Ca-activated chloride channel family protein
MKFYDPHWLWSALLIVPAALALFRWGALRRRASLDRIVAPRLHDKLVRSVDHWKRGLKSAIILIALALLCASIARPLYGLREAQVERAGVDVIIALDVSRSMMAEDAPSNRLTSAKLAITRLLDRPSPDRYGLITFAGEAYLMAPVTQDHGAIERSLNGVTTGSISKPGTDLAAAIKLAQRSYDETQRRGKALVLMSDGEQLQGDAVIAAREAAAKGIAIFSVGIGTTMGAKVPERQWGQLRFLKNEFGREVLSRLDEHMLQQVASAGHGFYAPLGPQGDGLIAISERGVQPLARGTQIRQSKDMREYFQWPLGLAIALLFWELLVNERKKNTHSKLNSSAKRSVEPTTPALRSSRYSGEPITAAPAQPSLAGNNK